MRRALKYAAIWCGATAVAVSVSWFGVRGVLRNEFVDDVNVGPFLAQTAAADERAGPAAPVPATPAPRGATSPEPSPPPATSFRKTPQPSRSVPSKTSAPSPRPARAAASGGALKVISVTGGEVVFSLGGRSCRLVSATPAGGYTAKVARADGWIRVDLARDGHGTGVFCIGHEQRTDTWEY
ncbi:hypothetical protein [Nonomuraea candida]|uniref:hypothetical protein n=1 Tax=Nonomuraea candida TaxID=359159 RepID=UPI000A999C4E|nr:hypothetical protein [Nonomuraea candida]